MTKPLFSREEVKDRPRSCPKCKYKFDCAAGLNTDDRPQAGDLTVCINCGTICFFTDDAIGMREATVDEVHSLDTEMSRVLIGAQSRIIDVNYKGQK